MLVLSRKLSQQIMIGSDVKITIVKIERNQVRIGIEAPDEVAILRGELIDNFTTTGADDGQSGTNHRSKILSF
jgi:carbon storage regulator